MIHWVNYPFKERCAVTFHTMDLADYKTRGGEKPPQLILLHLGSHCCLALDKSPFFSLKHIDQYNKTILLLKGDVADKAQSSMKSITMASPVG